MADSEREQRQQGAEQPLDQALQQQRQADGRLRSADQPHDLRLVAPRVEHEGRRGRHGEDRGERQRGADTQADGGQQALPVRQPLHPLRAARDLVGLGQRRQALDERAGAVGRGPGGGRRHLNRGGERVARELIGDAGVLAEHALERGQGLGLGDIAGAGDVGERADPLHERRHLGRRRLPLEVDDDAHAVAPLGDGAPEVEREHPEHTERDQRERDQDDRAHGHAAGAPEIAEGLAHDEPQHLALPDQGRPPRDTLPGQIALARHLALVLHEASGL